MKRRILSFLLLLAFSAGLLTVPAAAVFSDVPAGAWYAADVADVQKYSIINGIGDNRFDPQGTLTLAQAITMAARTYAYETGKVIPSDSSGIWYQPYLASAVENEICSPDEYGKDYNGVCSRLTMARLFYSVFPQSTAKKLNDVPFLPDVEKTARTKPVYFLYEQGVLTGSDKYGTFQPDASITRAETAAILNRVLDPSRRKAFGTLSPISAEDAFAHFFQSKGYRSVTQSWYYKPDSYDLVDFNGDGVRELLLTGGNKSGHACHAVYGFDPARGGVYLIRWKELDKETGNWRTSDWVQSYNAWQTIAYSSKSGLLHRYAEHCSSAHGSDIMYALEDGVLQYRREVIWNVADVEKWTLKFTLFSPDYPTGKTISKEEMIACMEEDSLDWPETDLGIHPLLP